jgi:hypothetical protein
LVADVGLITGGDETRQVVVATGWRKEIRPPSAFALITLFLVALGTAGTAKAEEPTGRAWSPRAYPTVRWFTGSACLALNTDGFGQATARLSTFSPNFSKAFHQT